MRFCQVALLLIFACFISCNPPSNKVSNQEIRNEPWHVRLEQIATGIENPVFLTHANDGSGRLFVILQEGKVLIMKGGSILRIDVSQGEPYSIPSDNPWVSGVSPEVWAYGLRNPYRFAFDPETKLLICSDVGDLKKEEIDIIVKGGELLMA